MKIKLLFLVRNSNFIKFLKNQNTLYINKFNDISIPTVYHNYYMVLKKKRLKKNFLRKSIIMFKVYKFVKKVKKINFFLFLNKFLLNFFELFLKSKIIFNLKKGSNRLFLNQISSRKFYIKYFKKNLKVTKQIIGILYYAFLLKDSLIFVNFFRKILEKLNIKSHKKVFLGLKKLLKDIFKPVFNFLGVCGIFFNVKGKIGVGGNAKKRRYYFYFNRHSITNRNIKVDIKYTPVWTFTGSLGFTFLIFY